jgi:hypothetical protein
MIQKFRAITDEEKAELESLYGGWWSYVDFALVLKIDEETALQFLLGTAQLLESGAIEEHQNMPPGSARYFRFVTQKVQTVH